MYSTGLRNVERGKFREIGVYGKEVVITTESPSETTFSGVRHSIGRKQFDSHQEAVDAQVAMVQRLLKAGWKMA